MSEPVTIYALGNQLYRVNGLEDPSKAAARVMQAWGIAEDLAAFSLFARIEDPLEDAFPGGNPDLQPLHRDIISVERLATMPSMLTKKDRAQIYLITRTSTHERRLEPQIDYLQKAANSWKIAHSASAPLSVFVNEHLDFQDDPNTLHCIATDIGQYRLVHTANLERTMAELKTAGNVYPYPEKMQIERCMGQLDRVREIHENNLARWHDTPVLEGPK
jgi:hypothetical protein